MLLLLPFILSPLSSPFSFLGLSEQMLWECFSVGTALQAASGIQGSGFLLRHPPHNLPVVGRHLGRVWLALGGEHYSWLTAAPLCGGGWGTRGAGPPSTPSQGPSPSCKASENESIPPSPLPHPRRSMCPAPEERALLPFPGGSGVGGSVKARRRQGQPVT